MVMTAMGYRPVNFQNKEGKLIEGTTLYLAFDDEKGGVIGKRCEKFFVNADVELPELKCGDEVEVAFDYKGRIEYIDKID